MNGISINKDQIDRRAFLAEARMGMTAFTLSPLLNMSGFVQGASG